MSKQCGENGGRSLNGQPCKRTDLKDDGLCTKHTDGNGRFTDEQVAQIGKLAAVLRQEDLAAFFEISHDTFNNRCKAQPEVLRAYEKGRRDAVAAVATSLLSIARGAPQRVADDKEIEVTVRERLSAQMFYLKCQGRWREVDRIEHTGADGGPIRHEHEEAEAIREQLYRRFKVIQGGNRKAS